MDLNGSRPADPEFDANGVAKNKAHDPKSRTRLPNGGLEHGHPQKFDCIGGDTSDDWPFHAAASVMRAHTLLRNFPEVDAEHTAVTGISWGGYTTCLVASLDDRFKAAVPVLDLCTDAGGGTVALLADGHVLRPGPEGNARILGFAPDSSQRLLCQAGGELAVLATARHQATPTPLPLGIYPLSTAAIAAPAPALAHLPEGTRAAGFDSLGNLCLANPQLRAVTKVTIRFRIPCPHCRQSVLMIFDANVQPENIGGF
jgi:hypothetical protein